MPKKINRDRKMLNPNRPDMKILGLNDMFKKLHEENQRALKILRDRTKHQ
ncbi:hypothetical protein [Paenibacillus vini]|uniref:FbpB family small basic protein n=1 Tax=Paenibacillus vini TaxID=1476024 RepID=A0ABQ4MAD1_9BACL|nr:hypothetical protein [Paenibacillus vini]GIP52937.1 hypothetical protein J42TS3_19720 [Paenibacillus vini]